MTAIIDYDIAKERISDFMKSFYTEQEDGTKEFKYSRQIGSIALRQQTPIYIDQDDVYLHDPELADWIAANTMRFRSLFYEVIDTLIKEFLGDNQVH